MTWEDEVIEKIQDLKPKRPSEIFPHDYVAGGLWEVRAWKNPNPFDIEIRPETLKRCEEAQKSL